MKKQTIMWTALPNGIVVKEGESRLRLSVIVSPQLKTDAADPTLGEFKDFLDWPSVSPKFNVKFEKDIIVPHQNINIINDRPRSDLWKALFNSKTKIRPYEFCGLDDRWIHSYPVNSIYCALKEIYSLVAISSSTDFPDHKPIFSYIRERWGGRVSDSELEVRLKKDFAEKKTVPSNVDHSIFNRLKIFHRPRNKNLVDLKDYDPEIDFHKMISNLGNYPALMRLMGLVYDLEIPLTPEIPLSSTLEINPIWKPALEECPYGSTETITDCSEDICPKTKYFIDPSAQMFITAPRGADSKLENGFLKLDDSNTFSVMQLDVDGASLKLLDFINNLSNINSITADLPETYSLPSMRSIGISLVQKGRATQLVKSLEQSSKFNKTVNNKGDVQLCSEDLVRGYRIDVWDKKSNKWHSLCSRYGNYNFLTSNKEVNLKDEGFISLGTTSAADNSSTDLYLHESLLTWGGWSLVAPRPGKIIDHDQNVVEATNHAATEFKLETSFKPVRGSLPKLRFGDTYRLRARPVDLAGNSSTLEERKFDLSYSTEPVVFCRFDPIQTPAVVLRNEVTSGESIERMVIRSNFNSNTVGSNERHIAPSRGNQLLAEIHGQFDTAAGLDKNAYNLMVSKDKPFKKDGIYLERQLALPYLPDPICRGAALLGLPGTYPWETTKIPFSHTEHWWEAQSFRIKIVEGHGAPVWNESKRVLTVQLPKAEVTTIRLSSYLSEEDLELMGIWSWIQEQNLSIEKLTELREIAINGRHWMLTPYREINLVHAVQQPLIAPQFQKLFIEKNLSETFAVLKDTFLIDGKSTNKLDIQAEWNEPIDVVTQTYTNISQFMTKRTAHAFEVPINAKQTWVTIENRHEFGDTKFRQVNYKIEATSRFTEYFYEVQKQIITLRGTVAIFFNNYKIVEHTDKLKMVGNDNIQFVSNQDYVINYQDGSIARTPNSKIPEGQNLELEFQYLPDSVSVTRSSPTEVVVNVLNSARPVAPKILYVIPTFGWEKTVEGDSVVVNRKGGGIRVYMDRPWYSSGDGELLGVVLWPGTVSKKELPPDNLKNYVTQWGMDPILTSVAPYSQPSLQNFKRTCVTDTGLSLDEINEMVNVAGYEVDYDADRGLWFSDLEIDSGNSYYPFVRLALARYQPNSVTNAHLSRVALADFVQLSPERLATVMVNPADPSEVNVSLCGPGYLDTSIDSGTVIDIEISVEAQVRNQQGELIWILVPQSVTTLSPAEISTTRMTWAGKVNLPEEKGSMPFRLVIKEFEWFVTDGDQNSIDSPSKDRRLVYVSAIEIV